MSNVNVEYTACRDCQSCFKPNSFPPRHLNFPSLTRPLRLESLSYSSTELVQHFKQLFTTTHKEVTQTRALQRWKEWVAKSQPKASLDEQDIDLQVLFEIFNDYFFCQALKDCTTIAWTDYIPRKSGYTWGHGNDVRIKIVRPQAGEALDTDEVLNTILHEMSHAMFDAFNCQCVHCSCNETLICTSGLTGHGELWKEIAQAMQTEADSAFSGFLSSWNLDAHEGGPSREEESNAGTEHYEEWAGRHPADTDGEEEGEDEEDEDEEDDDDDKEKDEDEEDKEEKHRT